MLEELEKCVVLWKGKNTSYQWQLMDTSFESFDYCQNTIVPHCKHVFGNDHQFKILRVVEFDNSVKYE